MQNFNIFGIFPVHGKMASDGPGGFFPTNPDLADILGRTDLDFENLYFFDILDPKVLDFQVPRSPNFWISRPPDLQIPRFPDFQVPRFPDLLTWMMSALGVLGESCTLAGGPSFEVPAGLRRKGKCSISKLRLCN